MAEGLARLACVSPADEVQFLGEYLVKVAQQAAEAEKRQSMREKVLAYEEKEQFEAESARKRQLALRENEAKREEHRRALMSELAKAPEDTSRDRLRGELERRLEFFAVALKCEVGASAVSIGELGGEGIEYIVSTQTGVQGQVQKRETNEEGEDQLYPFVLLNRAPEEEEGGAGEDEAADEGEGGEENALRPEMPDVPLPAFAYVEDALAEHKVVAFGVPRDGAYLAIRADYEVGTRARDRGGRGGECHSHTHHSPPYLIVS